MTVEVAVDDRMQRGYRYALVAPEGRGFDEGFRPELTPAEMLALGVFGGKYMTDCRGEFPAAWFQGARLSPEGKDIGLNYFGVDASQPLSVWPTDANPVAASKVRTVAGTDSPVSFSTTKPTPKSRKDSRESNADSDSSIATALLWTFAVAESSLRSGSSSGPASCLTCE